MEAYKRFIEYVKIHTASREDTSSVPSSACQFDLSKYLYDEMIKLGFEDVYADEHAYVYGRIPASAGAEEMSKIGLIAHIDTIPDFSGENVKPQVIENYDGTDVALGTSGRVLSPGAFPHLSSLQGQTLITTDGTTVLGADDKAGVAEIMTACEKIINCSIPHREICVCFTPDEEIGHGAALLDLDRLGADFAFTVDGGDMNSINYETFNAAFARFEVNGFNIHPGDAKGYMINASLVAMEINSMLPNAETPALTECYEGFFHLISMSGTVEKASLDYIVRDHDLNVFNNRLTQLKHIEKTINEKYGDNTAVLTVRHQYSNMAEIVLQHPEILSVAEKAVREMGLEPEYVPVRGGTDGSQLSYRGLPCPNLGTGGYACHGPYEHITAEALENVSDLLVRLVSA